MIINSKDSFFSFVDAAEFPEITLLQLRRRARTSIAGDGGRCGGVYDLLLQKFRIWRVCRGI
jgi:hypothetical protein